MARSVKIIWVWLALLIICFWVKPCFASNAFDYGAKLYADGKYDQACQFFRQAAALDPGNAIVHYYLANTLSAMNRKQEAIEEYGMAYWLDPKGSASGYCRQALSQFWGGVPRLPGAAEREATAYAASAEYTDSDRIVKQAKSLIRRQAAYEKQRHLTYGESTARNMVVQGETEADRIEDQAQADIRAALTPPSPMAGRFGGGIPQWDPVAAQQEADRLKKVADEKKQGVRQKAQDRAAVYKEIAHAQERALDEVVSTVEDELVSPASFSGVRLNPLGTDLYVRYYGHNQDLLAHSGAETNPLSPIGIQAKEQEGHFVVNPGQSHISISKDVRGKVIDTLRNPGL